MKQELEDMLEECTKELNDIEKRLKKLPPLDKARNYLTKYALIKACSTVEFVYHSIVIDYFAQLNDRRINAYLEKKIRKDSKGARYEMMKGLLGQFDEEKTRNTQTGTNDQWKETFKNAVDARMDGQRLISSSNSLVLNRNKFAHGKTADATFLDIKQYYEDVVELIRVFDSIVR